MLYTKNEIIQLCNICEKENGRKNPQPGRVYDIREIAPTLNTMQGGHRVPYILLKEEK